VGYQFSSLFSNYVLILSKNGLGYILGDFSTNSFSQFVTRWLFFACCKNAQRAAISFPFLPSYIEQPGDVGKMTLLLPQPAHLQKWTMTIQTDINIQVFKLIHRRCITLSPKCFLQI
jgi:hypothetical protein